MRGLCDTCLKPKPRKKVVIPPATLPIVATKNKSHFSCPALSKRTKTTSEDPGHIVADVKAAINKPNNAVYSTMAIILAIFGAPGGT